MRAEEALRLAMDTASPMDQRLHVAAAIVTSISTHRLNRYFVKPEVKKKLDDLSPASADIGERLINMGRVTNREYVADLAKCFSIVMGEDIEGMVIPKLVPSGQDVPQIPMQEVIAGIVVVPVGNDNRHDYPIGQAVMFNRDRREPNNCITYGRLRRSEHQNTLTLSISCLRAPTLLETLDMLEPLMDSNTCGSSPDRSAWIAQILTYVRSLVSVYPNVHIEGIEERSMIAPPMPVVPAPVVPEAPTLSRRTEAVPTSTVALDDRPVATTSPTDASMSDEY